MGLRAGVQRWAEAAKAGFSRVADIVLPPLCLGCGCGLDSHAALCGTCWAGVDFIDRPYCEVTGVPFPYEAGLGAVSAAAIANPPSYARARAVMRYNEGSTRLIHRFKYSDRMEAAPAFALWLVRAGAALLAEADLVVPVPLHKRRLFFRRFNQSAELSRAVARLAGIGCAPELLVRVRATRPQVGLSGDARRRNVAGAFRLAPGVAPLVKDRRIVLIDDVMTTGATAEACARVLTGAGAREVSVLCLARVVPAGGASI
ncbi:phosphoribosyltransferase [Parvibaculum lavamentivorans DS-1]|uniref:Phosphoribosyltransferase n=1 Tax=Parvibaculum lavamentivorans (strain DS-1 / DSM 13023 / NCIMB 13966) TaxID=402881 RepID=A7HTX2_PARL1|nr:ComF family protein [Parvibaculum lavamentivorans]ABS63355.1 phosphoribosyltransferase [Parvibaculum lavamentivorans DS-1]